MTDAQIIKALECCTVKNSCAECPLRKEVICTETRKFLAFDLINRQRKEIEASKELLKVIGVELENVKNLIVQNNESKLKIYDAYEQKLKTARAEAIKEFAEKLKKRFASNSELNLEANHSIMGDMEELFFSMTGKEMVGENDA